MTYYPGMEGGTALAEVIFGKTNPGGKLPFTIPRKEEDLPNMQWDTNEIWYDYYHGYMLLNKNNKLSSYPFGFGLSYTNFAFQDGSAWRDKKYIYGKITVINTGKREGAEVVQMYIGVLNSKVERSEYTLQAFKKIWLKPGERKNVLLSCKVSALDYYEERAEQFLHEDTEYMVYLGNSSDKQMLQGYLVI